ncbi:MAG: MerR family transcriptional regulator [Stackebrandtia sp.]
MRIAELSRTSGVPVPSIKYYLRIGLLPPGERTAPNQADYGQQHVHRLRLIRALVDVGGLSIAAVGDVLASLDEQGANLHDALGAAMGATFPHDKGEDDSARRAAREWVETFLDERGWDDVDRDCPTAEVLIDAVTTMGRFEYLDSLELVNVYADIMEKLAPFEVAWSGRADTPEGVLERAVVGTVIGGIAFSAVRRMAHQHVSSRMFGDAADS